MERINDFLGSLLLPHLPAVPDYLISTMLLAVMGFAARRWNIEISAAHIQKAHQALKTAALAGVRKGSPARGWNCSCWIRRGPVRLPPWPS